MSGCGVYDGTEIHEAAHVLLHLSRAGAEADMYAPDMLQRHVVNHLTGKEEKEEARNVLIEAARIARGRLATSDATIATYPLSCLHYALK